MISRISRVVIANDDKKLEGILNLMRQSLKPVSNYQETNENEINVGSRLPYHCADLASCFEASGAGHCGRQDPELGGS